ncbi:molybdenum ABC transporter ATP-binding protein [Campylobacter sp. MIT 99-7217]|uniref:ATP-binding cassette domain-containing protein n=1 Tax=Campylobacter sp. MIT 99-7217 TaxID=535091 RepID=UPI00115B9DB6|nr:ATP-binding cassette domain-containing protein [Campylobacter sp. MIT 99-7217]TQR32362.1 molybdenum ABC transporter ATP-binding protein [Campylobacter sp. MIT 99-7217]
MIQIHIKHPINTAKGELELIFDKSFEQGEFTCIFGESGAGKTTILRIIAGLLKPKFAFIKVGDKVWIDTQKNIFLPPQKRGVGFVFQDYALFPNLSVRGNLNFAFKGKDKNKIDELLHLLGLKELENAYPQHLSGGQAQRVALARAIISEPQILLLDEPLSALDFKMRAFLQDEILRITRHFKLTTLLVSHEISEIYKLCERVIELKEAKVFRDCPPSELFLGGNLSAKLQFNANVLEIKKADILMIITLLIGQNIVKITLSQSEFEQKYAHLKVGDNLLIASKAFSPMIMNANLG